MSDESLDAVVARIDERTRHTDAEVSRQSIENAQRAAANDQRFSRLEGQVADLIQHQRDRDEAEKERKDAEEKRAVAAAAARKRQAEQVNKFIQAGLTLLFSLLIPSITTLISQFPALHDIRGAIGVIAALSVGSLVCMTLLRLRSA